MPYTKTDIANMALMKVGSSQIEDITDTNSLGATACNQYFEQVVREVARSHPWSCISTRALLPRLPNPPGAAIIPPVPPYWQPNTVYTSGEYVVYVTTRYLCAADNTSSASFINDLTQAWWIEDYGVADVPSNTGLLYQWSFAYQLPADFELVVTLNGLNLWGWNASNGWNAGDNLFEIFGRALYTNDTIADIQYVYLSLDPARWDALFTGCVIQKLAASVATMLRKDDGQREGALEAMYAQRTLPWAKLKDGGERKMRAFDQARQSQMVRARYWSTSG